MAKKKVSKKKVVASTNKNQLITRAESDKLKKQYAPIVAKANKLVISKPAHEDLAYTELQTIKEAIKFIDGKRTLITKPLNVALKETNALFKELSAPLKDADKLIRDKILSFREEQRLIAEKKEATSHKIRAAHEAKGHKVHAPAVVEAKTGKSTTQKRWTFEVTNIEDVPVEYLVVDTALVNEAIIDGVRNIKGLRVYQKESLSVR